MKRIILVLLLLVSCGKQDFPECDGTDFFTVPPVDKIYSIIPLGNLNPPGHTFPTDHIYLDLVPDPNDVAPVIPIVAPGHIYVTRISEMSHSKGVVDYSIGFSVCKDFSANFIHLSSLSEKLREAFTDPDCSENSIADESVRDCAKEVFIEIQAGEELGTVGGKNQWNNFDFGAEDFREQGSLMRSRYEGAIVCPLDYFVPEIRSQYYDLLGSWQGRRRTIEPLCGTIYQDIAGTAQGYWYSEKETGPYSSYNHIALVHDNVDPAVPVFSVGMTAKKLESGAYSFTPKDEGMINRDFKEVSPGGIYCYEVGEFSIILEITDDTLTIEKKADCTEPWIFEDPAEYVR